MAFLAKSLEVRPFVVEPVFVFVMNLNSFGRSTLRTLRDVDVFSAMAFTMNEKRRSFSLWDSGCLVSVLAKTRTVFSKRHSGWLIRKWRATIGAEFIHETSLPKRTGQVNK